MNKAKLTINNFFKLVIIYMMETLGNINKMMETLTK